MTTIVRPFTPLLGTVLRITRLDDCGNPLPDGTEDAVVVTAGFVSVALTAETEDGTEVTQRRADGTLCVSEKFADSFKRLTATVTLCGVNPAAMSLLSSGRLTRDYAGDVDGLTMAEGTIDSKFALELWTGLSGEACPTGAAYLGGYMLLPYMVGGVLGDLTVDAENALNGEVQGAYSKTGTPWGAGPYRVLDDGTGEAGLPEPLEASDHFMLRRTTVAPPYPVDALLPSGPSVSVVVPGTGPAAGGTAITIHGVGLTDATSVEVGGVAATDVVVVDDRTVTATVPAGTAGAADVVVSDGTTDWTLTDGFVYA